MGTLYLVATPIGNLEDITYRAVRMLREVSLIAAEDTRTTRKLLSHYDIHTPLTSFHEYSDASRIDGLISRLQEEDVAVVSDAGMPAISDPGYRLVLAAIEHDVPVVPIPGPFGAGGCRGRIGVADGPLSVHRVSAQSRQSAAQGARRPAPVPPYVGVL